jgi:hypothetical protein
LLHDSAKFYRIFSATLNHGKLETRLLVTICVLQAV